MPCPALCCDMALKLALGPHTGAWAKEPQRERLYKVMGGKVPPLFAHAVSACAEVPQEAPYFCVGIVLGLDKQAQLDYAFASSQKNTVKRTPRIRVGFGTNSIMHDAPFWFGV